MNWDSVCNRREDVGSRARAERARCWSLHRQAGRPPPRLRGLQCRARFRSSLDVDKLSSASGRVRWTASTQRSDREGWFPPGDLGPFAIGTVAPASRRTAPGTSDGVDGDAPGHGQHSITGSQRRDVLGVRVVGKPVHAITTVPPGARRCLHFPHSACDHRAVVSTSAAAHGYTPSVGRLPQRGAP